MVKRSESKKKKEKKVHLTHLPSAPSFIAFGSSISRIENLSIGGECNESNIEAPTLRRAGKSFFSPLFPASLSLVCQ